MIRVEITETVNGDTIGITNKDKSHSFEKKNKSE